MPNCKQLVKLPNNKVRPCHNDCPNCDSMRSEQRLQEEMEKMEKSFNNKKRR